MRTECYVVTVLPPEVPQNKPVRQGSQPITAAGRQPPRKGMEVIGPSPQHIPTTIVASAASRAGDGCQMIVSAASRAGDGCQMIVFGCFWVLVSVLVLWGVSAVWPLGISAVWNLGRVAVWTLAAWRCLICAR